jgi:hypothetical protein
MSRVGFEPTIPAFKREKSVHVFDRVATAIGHKVRTVRYYKNSRLTITIMLSKTMLRSLTKGQNWGRLYGKRFVMRFICWILGYHNGAYEYSLFSWDMCTSIDF